MSTTPTCPDCGAPLDPAARGLCSRCLAELAIILDAPESAANVEMSGEAAGNGDAAAQPRRQAGGESPALGGLTERPGSVIGRYKLLEEIGEGGFGVVYLAEQVEPVRRQVALKIIKPGMDTREVVARFEVERQALALMDHPNIAKVLDGGATETGRPYFVMELVRGISITEYCDQKALSTIERLQVFMEVCHAVQHAHQKGIIHRDLKPSNILVTVSDGKPVPKIIDFGVAKALGQKLTEKTLFTVFQRIMGTPAYMSPEQAELSPHPSGDIDTRSDIYSLGVLLYELLTGVTPFDAETLGRAALDEVRRIIRDTDPPKPSTRLQTLGGRLPEVAKRRHTEPVTLSRMVRGDLDWIVMKCLEKDRVRRYDTADGLAADLKRHLCHEPVLAVSPSSLYKAGKFIRRHKVGLAASGALVATLIAGVVVSSWQALRATRAERAQTFLRQQAEQARTNEAALRRKAEAEQQKARTEALKSQQIALFLEDMLRGVGPSVAKGRDTMLLREILGNAAKQITQGLAGNPEVEAELLNTIGGVYYALGNYEQAEELHYKALEVATNLWGSEHLQVASSLYGLGDAQLALGKFAGAESRHREALEIRKKLRGETHIEVAMSLRSLGIVARGRGQMAQSEALFRQAVAMNRALFVTNHVLVANSMLMLGRLLQEQGKTEEAEPLLRDALGMLTELLGPDDLWVIGGLGELAAVLESKGDFAEAENLLRGALTGNRKLFGNEHLVTADSVGNLTRVLLRQGKQQSIEGLFREELTAARERYPKCPRERDDGIYSVLNVLLTSGAQEEPERLVTEMLAPAIEAQPESIALLLNRGKYFARRSRFTQAAADYARIVSLEATNHHAWYMLAPLLLESGDLEGFDDHRRKMLARFRDTTDAAIMESTAKASLLLPTTGADLATAAELAERSVTVGSSHPFVPYFELAMALARYRQGQYSDAEQWARKSLAHRWSNHNLQAPNRLVLAMTLQRLGHTNEARLSLSQGAAIVRGTWTGSRAGDLGFNWHDLLIARALLREAESTVGRAQ